MDIAYVLRNSVGFQNFENPFHTTLMYIEYLDNSIIKCIASLFEEFSEEPSGTLTQEKETIFFDFVFIHVERPSRKR